MNPFGQHFAQCSQAWGECEESVGERGAPSWLLPLAHYNYNSQKDDADSNNKGSCAKVRTRPNNIMAITKGPKENSHKEEKRKNKNETDMLEQRMH